MKIVARAFSLLVELGSNLSLASLLAVLLFVATQSETAWGETVQQGDRKMGSRFEIIAVGDRTETARRAVDEAYAEIDRIEALISSWRESSETSAVNRASGGESVEVSKELFDLVERSLRVSNLTGGAFDITFAGVGRLWRFKDPEARVPDRATLAAALDLIDFRQVELDREESSIRLAREGMRIGFGAIGKGYAANRAVAVLKESGATGGLVNAGGDLVAFGLRDDGRPWTVGIADPQRPDEVFAHIELSDRAVVTSGDYEQYFVIEGVRYAHILDPRTGWPVRGVASVTVVCSDGELADALATSVFVMGIEEGLALINALRGVEAMVVDDQGQLHLSAHWKTLLAEQPSLGSDKGNAKSSNPRFRVEEMER